MVIFVSPFLFHRNLSHVEGIGDSLFASCQIAFIVSFRSVSNSFFKCLLRILFNSYHHIHRIGAVGHAVGMAGNFSDLVDVFAFFSISDLIEGCLTVSLGSRVLIGRHRNCRNCSTLCIYSAISLHLPISCQLEGKFFIGIVDRRVCITLYLFFDLRLSGNLVIDIGNGHRACSGNVGRTKLYRLDYYIILIGCFIPVNSYRNSFGSGVVYDTSLNICKESSFFSILCVSVLNSSHIHSSRRNIGLGDGIGVPPRHRKSGQGKHTLLILLEFELVIIAFLRRDGRKDSNIRSSTIFRRAIHQLESELSIAFIYITGHFLFHRNFRIGFAVHQLRQENQIDRGVVRLSFRSLIICDLLILNDFRRADQPSVNGGTDDDFCKCSSPERAFYPAVVVAHPGFIHLRHADRNGAPVIGLVQFSRRCFGFRTIFAEFNRLPITVIVLFVAQLPLQLHDQLLIVRHDNMTIDQPLFGHGDAVPARGIGVDHAGCCSASSSYGSRILGTGQVRLPGHITD